MSVIAAPDVEDLDAGGAQPLGLGRAMQRASGGDDQPCPEVLSVDHLIDPAGVISHLPPRAERVCTEGLA